MLKDASTLPDGDTLCYDICIIGSGAAGITLAHQLRGSGPTAKTVVVLEGSLLYNQNKVAPEVEETLQRTGTHPEPEAAGYDIRALHRFSDPVAQQLYQGAVSAEMQAIDSGFLTRSRVRVYGGTTNCWGGRTRPLAAIDFDRSDLNRWMVWPITRDDLESYYAVAQRYCSLEGFAPDAYDRPEWWVNRATRPLEVLGQGTGEMRSVVLTDLNTEGPGVPDGARDFQVVWGPEVVAAPNIDLFRNANVKVLHHRAGSITHATCATIDYGAVPPKCGTTFTVEAKQFVVAAGGIESVRLLLASGLHDRPGTLGRFFMIHPLNTEAVKFKGPRAAAGVRNFYSYPFPQLRDQRYPPYLFAALTPTDDALRKNGIGNIRAQVGFDATGGGRIDLNWEQAPSPDNRVLLSNDPTDVDLLGNRKVFLDWRHRPLDQRTVEVGGGLVMEELRKLNLLDDAYKIDLNVRQPGDHHMGATRMSATDTNGYVDANCRVHHMANLFIASSSVFPTSGYANPTLTIIALAVRLADHLKRPRGADAEEPPRAEAAAV